MNEMPRYTKMLHFWHLFIIMAVVTGCSKPSNADSASDSALQAAYHRIAELEAQVKQLKTATPKTIEVIAPPQENRHPNAVENLSDEAEAGKMADKFLARYFIQEGNSLYAEEPLQNDWAGRYITQKKGVKRNIETDSLTEADKLNGFEFKGLVRYFSQAERSYKQKATAKTKAGWGEWKDTQSLDPLTGHPYAFAFINVAKLNGEWKISLSGVSKIMLEIFKPFPKADIPP